MEESDAANRRYEERRIQYLHELGITDKKKSRKAKPRKYIEDDEDVPDLQSEDDDSDDEDTHSRYQTSDWRNTHNAAAHSTLSAPSITFTDDNNAPTSTSSMRSKRTMNTLEINPPATQLKATAIRPSVNTVKTSEPQTNIAPNARSIQNLWHQRLGHPNNRRLREMANNPLYTSRGFPALSARQLDMKAVCDSCMIGKSHSITSHKNINHEATKKGQSWSVDVTGRKDTAAIGDKATIACVFVEHNTRLSVTYTIKNNDENTILGVLKQWNEEYLSLVKS
jgi:hypothetical protein